ncbi:MAG: gliding motility-associated C-terminal domain-containing protein [Bacteroidetes bacterium]|nr:gliding motility-associated C-terminal domain-containing protein [Bacteroidota bacterium]
MTKFSAHHANKLYAVFATIFLAFLVSTGASAQTAASYIFTANSTPYVSITGTNLAAIQADDATSVNVPLNFTFNFAGTNYTQVSACSNGWIAFSNANPSAATGRTNTQANANTIGAMLMPLWDDLGGQTGTPAPVATYTTTGTAPNRVFTMQWATWRWSFSSNPNVISFQVKLYETTNVIEFCYSQGAVAAVSPSATIGIFNTNTDWQTLNNATASPTAQTATFTTNISTKPATNQLYRWSPPPPCSGTPVAGTISATATSGCPGYTSTLSLTGATNAAGITYQWQSGPTATGPWTNVATTPTYVATVNTSTYYQCIVTCTNSGQSATTTPILLSATAHTTATLPFTESFESWVNFCSTSDVPTSFVWGNTPSTGNNSWRRDDQGATAAWGSVGSGLYSPVFTAGAHSARFHSFLASSGTQGKLDLYVDFSAIGSKSISFDYINTSGTDKLDVQVSTDGGLTFTTLVTKATSGTWSSTTVTTPAVANPAILRFMATSDFGATDIGLDNVHIDPPIPCNAAPAIAGPTATPSSFNCSGAPVLDLTTYPAATISGITYQWQSSPANQNIWTSISSPQTTTSFTAPAITANTDYRVIAVCTNTNQSTISATVTATVTGTTASPATSNICLGTGQILTATAPPVNVTLFSDDFNNAPLMTVNNTGPASTSFIQHTYPYTYVGSSTVTFAPPTNTSFFSAISDAANQGANTRLISPVINTSGFNTLTLTFNHCLRYIGPSVLLEVSTDGGLSWSTAQAFTASTTNATNGTFVPASVNLNTYVNQPNFMFRFNYTVGWDWWWAIDDVVLSGLSSTPSFSWTATPSLNSGLPAAAQTLSQANNNITVTPTAGGTYTYTVTSNAPGCVTASATVVVDPGPSGSMSINSTSICSGNSDTVIFTGTPLATVTYNVNAGPSQTVVLDSTGNAMVITGPLSSNTTYQLISVTAVNFCVTNYNTSSTITVNPLPVMSAGMPSSNSPVCSGNTLNLSVSTTPASSTYSWTGPAFGTPDPNQNPVVANAQTSYTGTYTVVATTSAGCSVTGTTNVVVNLTPAINVAANNTNSCSGTDGSVTISGMLPNANYTMSYTDATTHTASITSDGVGQYTITNLPAGTYTNIYVVQNACTSNVVNITVNDPPPPSISGTVPANPTACGASNGSITLQGLLPNTAYDLYYNNASTPQNITTNAAGNLAITNLAAGNYDSIYVMRVNCTSNVITHVVLSDPNAPNPPIPNDVVYCQFDPALPLSATATGTDVLKWYIVPSGGLGVTNAPVPSTNTPGTFGWYVTQTDSLGCESQRVPQSVLVKVKPQVPTAPTSAYRYCQFDSTAVQLSANGDSLKWYTQPVGGNPSFTAPTPSTTTAGTTTWYVSQTINGCESDRMAIQVTIITKPQPPIVKDITYCQFDQPVALTAIGDSLKWYSSPLGGTPLPAAPVPSTALPDTTIWYVSQTVNGCESDLSAITVIVYYKPTAEITTSRDALCQGDTILVSYIGNGTQLTTYDWLWPAGTNILSGTAQGPYVVQLNGMGMNTISLVASQDGCSSPSATHTVYVKQTPEVSISLRNNIVCTGDPVYLSIGYQNMEIANYLWNFNHAHTSDGSNSANGGGPYYLIWNQPGTYVVNLHVSSKEDCSADVADTVVVHEHPEAKISGATTAEICSGDKVDLSASVNNSRYTYNWQPQQFFDYDYNSPVVTAHVDASGYVSLKVTNEYGCESTDSVMINTKPCCELYLPSAFSPNGDGKNDLFRIINAGRHHLESLRVYNRYGQEVFSTSNEKDGWDGSYNGVAQEMGTYQYVVKFRCDGKDTYQKGEVTLVR